jgi:DNA-binding HxlR family transcriptional regulator
MAEHTASPGELAHQGHLTPFCPRFHVAVEIIGRRWSGVILRAMLAGSTRYTDIAGSVPKLSDRLLSERLKEFEAAGIVVRTVIPETPVRIEYHLTAKGRSLEQAFEALAAWAEEWVELEPIRPDGSCPALDGADGDHEGDHDADRGHEARANPG